MPVSLSTHDLSDAARAADLLAAPLDQPSIDDWRSAVNGALKHLLNADSAGFLLPTCEGAVVYSDEHDPEALAQYPDTPPPTLRSGQSIFGRLAELKVATLSQAYGSDFDRYLGSAYYHDYAGANGAHDTLAAMVSLGGSTARTVAGLQFWHERPNGRKFGEREVTLLRLLYPSFRVGLDSELRWRRHHGELLGMLDTLGQATLVCEAGGNVLHQTPALSGALAGDPEGASVYDTMKRAASGAPSVLEMETGLASYRITAAPYPSPFSSERDLVLVALERTSGIMRTPDELRARYQLTPTEIKVAALLARGSSNAEIATELCISPHTGRRHTERILFKLRAKSRAEVAMRMLR